MMNEPTTTLNADGGSISSVGNYSPASINGNCIVNDSALIERLFQIQADAYKQALKAKDEVISMLQDRIERLEKRHEVLEKS